jgi:hypothetical protein
MLIHELRHGPEYKEHWTQKQGHAWSFPGGLIDCLIMGQVPGKNINTIYEDLSDEQLASIKSQLAKILW